MKRQKITINEDVCVGCGLCTTACHQNVIGLVDGKAKVLREDFCDGLGNCLPVCPTGAISFTEIESEQNQKQNENLKVIRETMGHTSGCPSCKPSDAEQKQWPLQIKLVNPAASFFAGSDLLIAADCCAYACSDFFAEFMQERAVVIGCPKLDDVDYTEKLTAILANNQINSVTVTRMEVPCCGGIERAAIAAVKNCGKDIPLSVVTITTSGRILV